MVLLATLHILHDWRAASPRIRHFTASAAALLFVVSNTFYSVTRPRAQPTCVYPARRR